MRFDHRLNVVTAIVTAALALVSIPGYTAAAAEPIPDFCFLQISDMHVNPHPVGGRDPQRGDRSVDAIAWFCREAGKPQILDPVQITTPVPALVIATGDLTEYGVIHKTWDDLERLFEPLDLPLYLTPGNHDNTWTAMQHIMRMRRGGDHYSFGKSGCHFASINSATPQDPVPSLEQRTLTWLSDDLSKVPTGTPIFLFCHHPLSSGEFAKPFEQLRLLEVIEGHNVALLLMGHGHGVRHERWGVLDSVMGGSSFGPNTGYNIISVSRGILRVVYRFRDADKPMKVLLEKPITPPPAPRLVLDSPAGGDIPGKETPAVSGSSVAVAVHVVGGEPTRVTAALDDTDANSAQLTRGAVSRRGDRINFKGAVSTKGLDGGMHFLRVTADFGAFQIDRSTALSFAPRRDPIRAVRVVLAAGMKAAPVTIGDEVIVATTGGRIARISFSGSRGQARTLFDAQVEILHAPAVADGVLYFSAAEKGVHSFGLDGKLNWRRGVGAVVYGTPAVADDRVYVGDLEGFIHAIDRKTGEISWSKRHAQFSIEQSLLLHEGLLYFGAWDGFVYAVDARDGSLKWKQPGPAGHRSEQKYKSRYYAPADCSPIVAGDRLFVTDRAYVLGSYSLAGGYLGEIASGVAAIGLTEDGKGFYARGLDQGLTRYEADGKQVWSNPVPLGRFPVPPTEVAGKVFVCSNRGLLTVHDSATGKVLWKYQVTPQLHVMAPVAADKDGNAYVAGMDGTVTRIAPQD